MDASLKRRAAARLDRLAGDVLALVRDEERHELRDVLWLLDAPKFDVLFDALRLRLADRDAFLQHRSVTRTNRRQRPYITRALRGEGRPSSTYNLRQLAVDVIPHRRIDDAWAVRCRGNE